MSNNRKDNPYFPYEVIDFKFGEGGNAKVFKVKDANNIEHVLKKITLNNEKDFKKVKRFLNEIKVVEKYQSSIKGIVPISYKYIPEVLQSKESAELQYSQCMKDIELWYVMDLATPICDRLRDCKDIELIIECILSLSKTLSDLHKKNIVHRDIKPDNLYFYNEDWAFGDFGLVAYPELESVTKNNERVGNHATIAPEMRRKKVPEDPENAKSADVWSLAKTLWMILTNNFEQGFEGVYNPDDDAVSIKKHWNDYPIRKLEDLLQKATKYNPDERITIDEFVKLLIDFRSVLSSSHKILKRVDIELLSQNTNERKIINTADITENTDELLRDFSINWLSEERTYFDKGLVDEIKVLRYVKMKLEHYSNLNFIISPITPFFRNAKVPSIKVFVKYTTKESKFVTHITCNELELWDISHGNGIQNFYNENNEIDYIYLDKFTDVIKGIAFVANADRK